MSRKEFRSDCGKLLFVKTDRGYEIKCPRDKKIYVIPYEDMINDAMELCDECQSSCLLEKMSKNSAEEAIQKK